MIGIHIDGIEEYLAERRAAVAALADAREKNRVAKDYIQRLTSEINEKKSKAILAAREREKLLSDGSPAAQDRLKELRTLASTNDLAVVEEELNAIRTYSDAIGLEEGRARDRVARVANRIYERMYQAFLLEAKKRLGPDLLAALSTLRYVQRKTEDFPPPLRFDDQRRVLTELRDEYMDDLPPQGNNVPAQQNRAAVGR